MWTLDLSFTEILHIRDMFLEADLTKRQGQIYKGAAAPQNLYSPNIMLK